MLLNTSIGLDGNNFHPSSASRTFHAGWRLIKKRNSNVHLLLRTVPPSPTAYLFVFNVDKTMTWASTMVYKGREARVLHTPFTFS